MRSNLLTVVFVLVAGCTGNFPEKENACADQTCSGHGECMVTPEGQVGCVCDPGYQAQGQACVREPTADLDGGAEASLDGGAEGGTEGGVDGPVDDGSPDSGAIDTGPLASGESCADPIVVDLADLDVDTPVSFVLDTRDAANDFNDCAEAPDLIFRLHNAVNQPVRLTCAGGNSLTVLRTSSGICPFPPTTSNRIVIACDRQQMTWSPTPPEYFVLCAGRGQGPLQVILDLDGF